MAPDEPISNVVDYASVGVVIGTLMGWLPTVSVILSIIWLLLRIWESETVREWTNRQKETNNGPTE